MKKQFFAWLLCAAVLIAFAIPLFAAGTTKAADMRLSDTENKVTVKDASGRKQTVRKGMRLYSGYTVETGRNSSVYITLDNSKAVRMDGSGKLRVRKSGKKLELILDSGKMFFAVSQKLSKKESMNIRTSTMITGIRGTIGVVETIDSEHSTLLLLEGETVSTNRNGEMIALTAGQILTVTADKSEQGGAGEDNYVIQQITGDDIPGFVLTAMADDPELADRVADGLSLDKDTLAGLLEEADERLAKDRAAEEREPIEPKAIRITSPVFDEEPGESGEPEESGTGTESGEPEESGTGTESGEPEESGSQDEPEPVYHTVTFGGGVDCDVNLTGSARVLDGGSIDFKAALDARYLENGYFVVKAVPEKPSDGSPEEIILKEYKQEEQDFYYHLENITESLVIQVYYYRNIVQDSQEVR